MKKSEALLKLQELLDRSDTLAEDVLSFVEQEIGVRWEPEINQYQSFESEPE